VTAIEELLAAVDAAIERFEAICQCAPVSGCLDAQRRHGQIAAVARVRAELAGGEMSDEELCSTYWKGATDARLVDWASISGLRAVERAVRARRP